MIHLELCNEKMFLEMRHAKIFLTKKRINKQTLTVQ